MTVASYHGKQGLQPVGLGGGLVPADAMDAREAHGDARFVAARGLDGIEGDLEHQRRAHRPDGTELLDGVVTDEAVELQELRVGEAGIGLAHRHELVVARVAAAPGAESIVGIVGGALAVAARGIHENAIDGEGGALPFVPEAARAARDIEAVPALQHQPLDAGVAGCRTIRRGAPRSLRRQ